MNDHRLTQIDLSKDALARYKDTFERIYNRNARNIYVIMNKTETTVLKDPGLDRPWSGKIFKLAEGVAKEVGHGAHVTTLEYALNKLISNATERN